MRIQRISLTDFRAFPGPAPVTFELGGKNLLVYGENGAGKSSLFHALRDFFSLELASDMAKQMAAQKNVFSSLPLDQCAVEVAIEGHRGDRLFNESAVWSSQAHPATRPPIILLPKAGDGPRITTTVHHGTDLIIRDAARRAAFLDYRSLLDTNYRHGSEEVNLFELAKSALLRDFRVTVEGGKEATIGELWLAIEAAQKAALDKKRSDKKDKKDEQVNKACETFTLALRSALERLLPIANELLHALGWGKVELTELNCPGVFYKHSERLRKDRKVEGLKLTPRISFNGKALDRPQSFLNEARLSGLALALYLGGRLACVPTGESQALKLLVLDDVLVGLDHSNRLPVLDVLASHFADWQVVLLTHDRTWFELTQSHVDEKAWNCVEIYEGDAQAAAPCPIVRKAGNRPAINLLAKAKELLTTPYLEAAANYTRQGFELAIRGVCEAKGIDMPYRVYPKGHKRPLESNEFLGKLKQWKASDQQKQTAWDDALKKLNTMKSVVMNPYSHPSAPNIPKQEIQQAIDAVEAFLALAK